ncbi:uncharacterized protein N0V89_003570 [Didymosphaeria variabile]|uniref:Fe2OG dioxygenase domain-containing protein n=1 Tax=Didymosphaeria variabile TaxID=1932322 RepID=A0A9W8XNS3_9PLEO|nr:uncharacterized protein N0V89_003570 [Didymosphaeria variabile]KAJ4355552.1 hypothetical protein N0V89_003570 [Didymosphaeria variabile]
MPHSEHTSSPIADAFVDLPSFPDNVPTAPLLRISLAKLLQNDVDEQERCWRACCELGFFYLDLNTDDGSGEALLQNVEQLFEIMKGFFELPVEEKTKYDFADQGSYFGYKGYGKGIVDGKGTRDKNEFYNISKDDILNLSEQLPCPDTLNQHRPLFESYIRSSHSLCMLITSLLSSHLPLKPETRNSGGLESLHSLSTTSGDQIRFVKAPPQPHSSASVALGEHTDFGSVTILFNRLGGLQVRLPPSITPTPPSSSEPCSAVEKNLCQDGWTYVRPLPGHCIVNLGDALVKFSGGRLRSNIHRVVPPPGEQGKCERYSLVYFCRPGDDVVLRALVEGRGMGKREV